ncbi:MAG TPA: helix-turn-helix domain-containing protein [Pseudonocardiaceae bacterium]|nr:helix-turn-helix domain-containing protein [Pseudonocardiaceae bacterium]
MDTEPARPKLRRDAQRSVEKLKAAAVEVFAEFGLNCPLEEIARRAGVSPGTLYHRFGSREGLIDAVVPDVAAARLAGAVRYADEGTDPWQRFVRYVEQISALMAGDPALSDVITRRYADTPRLSAVCEETFANGHTLLVAAQQAGAVRTDITAQDLTLLFWSSAAQARATAEIAPDIWRRGLALTLDGLRTDAAHPLPVAPLDAGQALAAMHHLADEA